MKLYFFDILSKESILEIVKLRIEKIKERLLAKGIFLELDELALAYLGTEGYNPHYGARPLNRLIQNKVLNPVANMMISNTVKKGDTVFITTKNNELLITSKKEKLKSNLKIKSKIKCKLKTPFREFFNCARKDLNLL